MMARAYIAIARGSPCMGGIFTGGNFSFSRNYHPHLIADKYTIIYILYIYIFTITKILGNSGVCVNSVYQAAFPCGLESRLDIIMICVYTSRIDFS